MDWFFNRKVRHKVAEFVNQTLMTKVYRVRIDKETYGYQIEILARKKYDFKKIGSLKQEDSRLLVKLLGDVDRYVNGRH